MSSAPRRRPAGYGTLEAGTLMASTSAVPAAAPVAVALWQSATHPPEVVRVDLTARRSARRSPASPRREWPASTCPRPRRSGSPARGARIHNLLVRPPAFDPARKYPLLVVMHGGPHGAWRDEWVLRWNYHLLGAPGYVVLLTNYMGSTGFGEAFAQRIQGDPLEGPALEINQAADEAIARYPFVDGTRQVAGGASYGGPSRQLDGRHHDALSRAREPCRAVRSRRAVGHERHRLLP